MKILALDTSTTRGSVALLQGRELVAELRLHSPETHSARLLRSIRFLLESAGWRLGDLALIAAGCGPGSFTGIRIGLATGMGLAQTLGIPFAGVSGLVAIAHQVPLRQGVLGVVMDAQRSQVYFARFAIKNGRLRNVEKPGLWNPADLAGKIAGRQLYLVGDGASLYAGVFRGDRHGWPYLLEVDLFVAASIGRVALKRKRTWRSGAGLRADAVYIRLPDARKPGSRKR